MVFIASTNAQICRITTGVDNIGAESTVLRRPNYQDTNFNTTSKDDTQKAHNGTVYTKLISGHRPTLSIVNWVGLFPLSSPRVYS
jgi:hypothetical protein